MPHFSFDSQAKLDSSVYGFDSYTTADAATVGTQPRPMISPADVLLAVKELRKIIDNDKVLAAIQLLEKHVTDIDNPHKTDLGQFSDEISDVLYSGYVKAGGTASFAAFTEYLFSKIRVATADEINTPNAYLLVSVASANRFFKNHEADTNAHSAMVSSMFPGCPIQINPEVAVYSEIGIPDACVFGGNEVPYTYVDEHGVLTTAKAGTLPIEYINGVPYIPCFETRTNEIVGSNTFASRAHINVNSNTTSGMLGPDRLSNCTQVLANVEPTEVEHCITLTNVEYRNSKTFSIFAKRGDCQFLSICISDNLNLEETRAQFNLDTGTAIIFNHLNRYKCRCKKLADGWFRCEITLHKELNNSTNLRLLWHKLSDPIESSLLKFKGNGEVCGYLYGAQLELGYRASPYIPTTLGAVTRNAIGVKIELSEATAKYSVCTSFINSVKIDKTDTSCIIYSLADEQGNTCCKAELDYSGRIIVTHSITHTTNQENVSTDLHIDYLNPSTNATTNLVAVAGDKKYSVYANAAEFSSNAPETKVPVKYVEIGHCGDDYLNDYLSIIMLYSSELSKDEAKFSLGEKY